MANPFIHKLAHELSLDEAQESVIQYGFQSIAGTFLNIVFVVAIALPMGILGEAITILLTIMAFKKFSGGAHCHSLRACLFTGTAAVIIMSLMVKHWGLWLRELNWLLLLLPYCVLAITYKLAPRDVPQKPITNVKQRFYLKCLSVFYVLGWIIFGIFAIITNTYITYYLCGVLALLWQALMLTPFGFYSTQQISRLF